MCTLNTLFYIIMTFTILRCLCLRICVPTVNAELCVIGIMTSVRRRYQATVARLRLLLLLLGRLTAVHLAQMEHVGRVLAGRSGRRQLGCGRLAGSPDAKVAAGGAQVPGPTPFLDVRILPADAQVLASRATPRPDPRRQHPRLPLGQIWEEPPPSASDEVLSAVLCRHVLLRLEPVVELGPVAPSSVKCTVS